MGSFQMWNWNGDIPVPNEPKWAMRNYQRRKKSFLNMNWFVLKLNSDFNSNLWKFWIVQPNALKICLFWLKSQNAPIILKCKFLCFWNEKNYLVHII